MIEIEPVTVWGLPFAPLTRAQALDAVSERIGARRPFYLVTANTHYAMLSDAAPGLLGPVNDAAEFIVADGAPLVWASRRLGTPLPERVAGSDLIFDLAERAARDGLGVYLFGGAPGVADEAAEKLAGRYPGLRVVGTDSPPYREMTPEENDAARRKIRAAAPDILMVAFTMPKGEVWIHRNYADLGVPLCVNLGAGLDFAAGRIKRAPRKYQAVGLEWAYRLALEPRRLFGRYARNALFALRMVARDLTRRPAAPAPAPVSVPAAAEGVEP